MCFEGRAVYYDWYEMFPTDPVTVTEHQVAPGDKVSASVTRSGAAYRLVAAVPQLVHHHLAGQLVAARSPAGPDQLR
jgi:hypothetical protein